ncbi:hypothetical protein JD76_03074 [Micromonospora endolithica]|nr:hypothetical protein JD76_03074 [Micromonospora endolithica]
MFPLRAPNPAVVSGIWVGAPENEIMSAFSRTYHRFGLPQYRYACPLSSTNACGSISPFSTSGRPIASRNGPVGLSATATPIAIRPVARFLTGTYQ